MRWLSIILLSQNGGYALLPGKRIVGILIFLEWLHMDDLLPANEIAENQRVSVTKWVRNVIWPYEKVEFIEALIAFSLSQSKNGTRVEVVAQAAKVEVVGQTMVGEINLGTKVMTEKSILHLGE